MRIQKYNNENIRTLKGVCHVWIDLGLYKNLWLFLIFSNEPLILYLQSAQMKLSGRQKKLQKVLWKVLKSSKKSIYL